MRPEDRATEFHFEPLTQADAEAIAEWRYPEPYSFYDWMSDPGDLRELLEPTRRGEAYWAVREIGLGLRPDLTGRGIGASFLAAGLEFARARFAPERFTLAVATFNERAITVYERAGFARGRVYMHWTNGAEWEFIEMSRSAG